MNVILSHLILNFVVVGSGFLKLSPFYTVQGSVQGVQVFVASVRSLCTCTIPTSTEVLPKACLCWPLARHTHNIWAPDSHSRDPTNPYLVLASMPLLNLELQQAH
jgi:hypothetical protein